MAKKTNSKSIRLSDQVMDYVNKFDGSGFNQKFENLVLFCMKEEENKRERIASLDREIDERYKKLDAVRKLPFQISDLSSAFERLDRQTHDIISLMDKLIDDENDGELPFP